MLTATPRIHPAQCTRYRYRYSTCSQCVDACPHAALEARDDGVVLDAMRCRNCGLCDAACPTGTFHCESLPDPDRLRSLATRDAVSIACTPSGHEGDLRVPCLGAIGPTALAVLVNRGAAVTLRGAGHCEHCEHAATGTGFIDAQMRTLDELLDVLTLPEERRGSCVLERSVGKDTNRFDGGRRAFFRRALGYVEKASAPPASSLFMDVPDAAIRAARHHVPMRRRMLDALLETGEPGAARLRPDSLLFAATLELETSNCTRCEACARACPTGALDVDESQQRWTMQFDGRRCVACGVCVEVCQPGVLYLSGIGAAETPRTLHVCDKLRCDNCNRPFVPLADEGRCGICGDDDRDFSDIFGSPS
ncbi:MAG: 4Fe-4S binding protein [Chromatiales bacterium]|jgi:Fe-S-cluster-containing hydrogenase component 2|nr:4Fe-4S binding protein [Chromatiales bacterium]MDX9767120.1 4Fe-4S binding protein [Ectothiorhodospiraceae bacterium]